MYTGNKRENARQKDIILKFISVMCIDVCESNYWTAESKDIIKKNIFCEIMLDLW